MIHIEDGTQEEYSQYDLFMKIFNDEIDQYNRTDAFVEVGVLEIDDNGYGWAHIVITLPIRNNELPTQYGRTVVGDGVDIEEDYESLEDARKDVSQKLSKAIQRMADNEGHIRSMLADELVNGEDEGTELFEDEVKHISQYLSDMI